MVQGLLLAMLLLQAEAPPAPPASPALPAWMAGCWVQALPNGSVEETWTAPGGGTMIGMGRTVTGAQTASYEFMRIAQVGRAMVFVASPGGQSPTTFQMRSISSDEVVFENLAHDFPQRVIYRRGASGTMAARIEGRMGGELKGEDFAYRRCPGSAPP